MTDKQVERIASALWGISRGESHPAGLEGVAMALAGEGLRTPVGPALADVAPALYQIAAALEHNTLAGKYFIMPEPHHYAGQIVSEHSEELIVRLVDFVSGELEDEWRLFPKSDFLRNTRFMGDDEQFRDEVAYIMESLQARP